MSQFRWTNPNIFVHKITTWISCQQLPSNPGLHKILSFDEGSKTDGKLYCQMAGRAKSENS